MIIWCKFKLVLICFLALYGFLQIQRSLEKRLVSNDIGNGRIIESKSLKWFQASLVIILILISLEHNIISPKYAFFDSLNPWLRVVSVFLYSIGLCLRILAIRALGRFWSYRVELKTNHIIVRRGIYRYIKHPGYVGNIYIVAMALFCEAIVASIFAVIVVIIFGIYRVTLEEKYVLEPLRNENSGSDTK